uniref:Heme biosynthesis protein n=1 Tax=Ophirina amphinema TaxID=2108040 RepID=A0A348AYQ6_9EUKA|nr:heme biosynthesis protein [Ophirina amphinema]
MFKVKDRQTILLLVLSFIVLMVGLSYGSVPLYKLFCQVTGFGGTVQVGLEAPEVGILEDSKIMTIQFNADVSDSLPWSFKPCQKEVKVRVGETALAFFEAENLSQRDLIGISTYNVSPQKAGLYFNKIQCFCFEEQQLNMGERVDMPVFFFVDPQILLDPRMSDVNNITLSYTFFPSDD